MASKNQAKQAEILGDAEFNKKWEQEGQFQFLRKSNDPRFGEISLYKNKSTNDLIFAKEKLVTSKQQASNDIRDLKSRIALNHPNLHRLTGYSTAIQKELCSTNYLTRAYYEFPKSDLQKEINDRKQNGGQFSGDELLNFANQSINGLTHLHKLDISHGDVRPLNIGFNRDTREVQILDRLQDPSPLEKLQTNNIINKKDLFISPEVYRKLQGKDKTLKYNPYKNDLYSLGLSLITAGNNEPVQNIYKPNGDLDHASLENHLRNFDGKYAQSHPGLSNLVHTLVAQDENNRWTAQQYVDGFNGGQFSGHAAPKVHSQPPVNFGNETTTQQVYSAPPVEFNQHQGHNEETAVLYNADEQNNKPNDNYAFANTNYEYNNLAQPVHTTYVNSAPQQTVYYTNAHQSHYVSSAPTTTYYTSDHVSSTPKTHYVSSTPQTTYTSYSTAPTEYNQTTHQVYSAEPTSTIVNSGITTVSVTRMDGTTYSYTVDEKDRDNIVQDYEKHDPRYNNGNGQVVSGTRVETVSPTVVYSTPPQAHYVEQGAPVYHTSKVYSTPSDNVTYSYQPIAHKSGSIFVSQTQPASYTNYTYSTDAQVLHTNQVIDPSIEVRRGSSQPTQVQDQSIKKKYIIEGDNVIEVQQDN